LDGAFTVTNCTAAMTHDLNQFYQAGTCTLTGVAVAKPLTYCRTENATIAITNPTVAGAITRVNVRAGGAVNISGTAGTVNVVDCSTGVVAINGGASHLNITKTMGGTLTTGNFTTSNVSHHSSTSKTMTANNTNRADYIGLVSTAPIV
jgi:hypothetical protein